MMLARLCGLPREAAFLGLIAIRSEAVLALLTCECQFATIALLTHECQRYIME